jgi:uncharacterized Tic20 family protein
VAESPQPPSNQPGEIPASPTDMSEESVESSEVQTSPQTSPPPPTTGPVPPRPPTTYAPPVPLSPSDERTWAMLAHLSILANLVTVFLGTLAALVIYLVYKDRSRYVAYQSMQAFLFQLIWWVGGGILAAVAWTISGILAAILIGCLLMPIALLISLAPLVALVYGVIGAVQCNQGQDFRYWLIGDWVRSLLN